MAILLSLSPHPLNPPQNPNPTTSNNQKPTSLITTTLSKRQFVFQTTSLCLISLSTQNPLQPSLAESSSSSKSYLLGIANTKSWFQVYGDGLAIRIPPQSEDIMEPEDYSAGMSLYGDEAKPKTVAARFASPDGYIILHQIPSPLMAEVLSVVIRPSNQLKITFLEICAVRTVDVLQFFPAQDISDLVSLKRAAKLFVPGGATLYSARTLKIQEEGGFRTYYLYEFGRDEQHVALVAVVNSGKAIIAGATTPQSKWDDDFAGSFVVICPISTFAVSNFLAAFTIVILDHCFLCLEKAAYWIEKAS